MMSHRKKVAGLRKPVLSNVVYACQPASPCVAPAGNPSAGYGGRGVGAFGPAGAFDTGFRATSPSATFEWRLPSVLHGALP